MTGVRVLIRHGFHSYYLLKVQRRGLDVYCFVPRLGIHHSRHCSGESHFRREGTSHETGKEPPIVLIGDAGTPVRGRIRVTSLAELGSATSICTAICPIDFLDGDFPEFRRSTRECFVIERDLFPESTKAIVVGIWAVPANNKASFDCNNRNIPESLLHRVTSCDPQIWLFAQAA